jgi:hypothetical protein
MNKTRTENLSYAMLGATLAGSLGLFLQQVLSYTNVLG